MTFFDMYIMPLIIFGSVVLVSFIIIFVAYKINPESLNIFGNLLDSANTKITTYNDTFVDKALKDVGKDPSKKIKKEDNNE